MPRRYRPGRPEAELRAQSDAARQPIGIRLASAIASAAGLAILSRFGRGMPALDPAVDLVEELVDQDVRRRPSSAPGRARRRSRRRGRPRSRSRRRPPPPARSRRSPSPRPRTPAGTSRRRSSTTTARLSTPTLSRPHDGHAIITGPRSRSPSAFRISQATSTSFTGSAVSETRIVSPIPSISSEPMPTALLIEPGERRARLGDAEVERVRHPVGEHPVGADHRRHVRGLDRDLEVAVVEPLEDLDLLERLDDERLGRVLARELLEVLRQRAGVGADPHRDPGPLRGLDDLLDLVRPADVAGVDPHGGDAGVDRLERERGVEVDVGDHRDRREPDDQRQRVGVLDLRDGDADDLAAGRGERGDLRRRRLDVVRLRQRHRLDDDRRAAADRDAADADPCALAIAVRVAAPRAECEPTMPGSPELGPPGAGTMRRAGRAASDAVALEAPPDDIPTTSGRSAPTSSPGPCSPRIGWASSRCRWTAQLGWFSPARRARDPARAVRAVALAPARGAAATRSGSTRRSRDVVAAAPTRREPHELDRRRRRRGVHAAARARLGALGRGVGRRRARGRALRRRDRRALRGRVDVPPRAPDASKAALRRARRAPPRGRRRRPAPARRPVAHAAPRRRSAPSRSPRAEYHRRLRRCAAS